MKDCTNNSTWKHFERLAKSFRTDTNDRLAMYQVARKFAAEINCGQPHWLTLSGASGCGKTMLARCVWRSFMDCSRFDIDYEPCRNRVVGNTGQWCDWRSLISELRNGLHGRIDDICEDTFVVLDDVGASHDPNGYVVSVLDRILNERMRKWTLITTNFSLGNIGLNMDQRIASRMIRDANVFAQCNAPDYAISQALG